MAVLLDLVQNLALLVALAAAYRIMTARWDERSRRHQIFSGLLFGAVAVVGILTPVRLDEGLIFDGRSIILGVAGFVGGPLVALIAAAMAGAVRVRIGGVGTAMGLSVIASAAAVGVAFRAWRTRTGRTPGFLALWGFGLAIHGVTAALLLTLPGGARQLAWAQMGAAILLVYPLATTLICKIFLDYERRDRDRDALVESKERMELALRGADLGTWDWDVGADRVVYDRRYADMFGVAPEGLGSSVSGWSERIHHEDLPGVMARLDDHLAGRTPSFESEHRLRDASGRWVWVLDRGRVLERAADGRPLRMAGTYLDVTSRMEADRALVAREERLRQQNTALLALLSGGELFGSDFRHAVRRITEAAAGMLGAGRVSLWWFSDDFELLTCWDVYEAASASHTEGEHLSSADFPAYVDALRQGVVIAASDVRADPRTRELPAEYWDAHGICSLLDAPVWLGPRVAGVLCTEHLGEARSWTAEDERLATTLAALVSLCAESTARAKAEETARGRLSALERVGAELRRSLEEAERARRALLSTLEDRKRVEEALRENEAFIRAVMDNLPLGVAVNSVDPSVDFVYMNDRFPRVYRTTREALADPDRFWESAYQDQVFRERIRARVLADVGSGDPARMHWDDVPLTREGEETTYVSARNIPIPARKLMISTVWDVTDRKRAEDALRAGEERYRELFESSPQILWVYDVETLAFLDVNDAAIRHYGYTRDEFLAMTLVDIRPPEDEPALRASVARLTGGLDEAGVWRHLKKDGTLIDVDIRSHTLDFTGRPAELVMVTDVTERLRQEAQIRALTEGLEDTVRERTRQLREANAELESFSYTVSHDLKAPLRAIDGYSALLEESVLPTLDPAHQRMVQEVRKSTQQMGRLIEDLLTFSRVGRAAMSGEAVPLGPLVLDLMERERHVSRGRRIELEADGLPEVWGDPTLLRQAFDNILGNAVKFTRTREVARIEVTAARNGRMMEVKVRDNGVGFDTRYRHKLFRVFERLHYPNEFEGTGVGLAIVKRIVERHGGKVSAESELDEGTVITLTLPAVPEGGESGRGGREATGG